MVFIKRTYSMLIYILHFGYISSEGELSIGCEKPYTNLNTALERQRALLQNWKAENSSKDIVHFKIGNYESLSVKDGIAEIQTHIEEYNL